MPHHKPDNHSQPQGTSIRSGLAFVFMPQFRLSFTSLGNAGALFRPLLLIPLVVAGLLPERVLTDNTSIPGHIYKAIYDLFSEAQQKNWTTFARKAPALLAVLGLIFFFLASTLTFLLGLALTQAHAQDAGVLDASVFFDDPGKARDLITSIFGDSSSDPASTLFQGTLGTMLLIYNGGMYAVALIILIYQAVFLFVGTAEDKGGEGGGRTSKAWFVIRTVLVFALMAPAFDGFSGGQKMIIGIGNIGSSFASKVWSGFAESTIAQGRPIATPKPPSDLEELVGKLLIIEACTVSANTMAALAGDAPYIVPKQVRVIDLPAIKQIAMNYDGTTGALDKLACGQVKFPYVNQDQDVITTPIIQAQLNAYKATSPAIIKLAKELSSHFIPGNEAYGTPMPDPGTEIDNRRLVQIWHQSLLNAIQQARQLNEGRLNAAVSEQVRTDGWVAAGSWFQTIASVNGQFIDATSALPTITMPLEQVATQIPVTSNVLAGLNVWWDGYRTDRSLSSTLQRTATSVIGGSDVLASILEFFNFDAVIESFKAESGMPLADLSALGHILVNTALVGFGSLGGASVLSLGTAGTFLNFIGLGLLAILVPGATLAWWLPLLPFIRFIFGILGWLLNLLEAIVLCPLFLICHLGTEGQGIYTPATRPGYQLLLALVLRPVLMVIALVAALLIFNTVMGLFNDLFLPTIIGANNGSKSGPISTIFYIMIYCTTAYGLANASFKAIDILPNRVLNWIGSTNAGDLDGTGDIERRLHGGTGKGESLMNRAARPGKKVKP